MALQTWGIFLYTHPIMQVLSTEVVYADIKSSLRFTFRISIFLNAFILSTGSNFCISTWLISIHRTHGRDSIVFRSHNIVASGVCIISKTVGNAVCPSRWNLTRHTSIIHFLLVTRWNFFHPNGLTDASFLSEFGRRATYKKYSWPNKCDVL